MAQFSCIYCGRKLQVKGQHPYGKGRCPSCRHIIFIPRRDRINKFIHEKPVEDKIDWSKLSDEQVAEIMEYHARSKADPNDPEAMRKIWKSDFRTFLPSYDEVTLFTLSFAFILLYLISSSLREDFHSVVFTLHDIIAIIAVLLSALGMCLSLINVFSQRIKYDFEKYLMLFFAVMVTAVTGIYSGLIILEKSKGLFLIFPIWNIVNGVILLLLLRLGTLDIECIVENGFDFAQIMFSILAVGIILGFCNYVSKMHWALSYSICACYTITINDAIHNILGINRNNKPLEA